MDSSEHFHNAAHSFADHGIEINMPKVNLPQMMKRKAQVVEQTCAGIDFLMKKNKIDVLKGWGSFVDATHIKVSKDAGEVQIEAAKTIIATGSKPTTLPFIKIDKERGPKFYE